MTKLNNYIDGQWVSSYSEATLDVKNPANQEVLAKVPQGSVQDVQKAAEAAARAFPEWRNVPAHRRVQYLFKLKSLLEDNIDDISRTIVLESGKTFGEAKAEMQRAIENVENACGIPTMIQGTFPEDIAR